MPQIVTPCGNPEIQNHRVSEDETLRGCEVVGEEAERPEQREQRHEHKEREKHQQAGNTFFAVKTK